MTQDSFDWFGEKPALDTPSPPAASPGEWQQTPTMPVGQGNLTGAPPQSAPMRPQQSFPHPPGYARPGVESAPSTGKFTTLAIILSVGVIAGGVGGVVGYSAAGSSGEAASVRNPEVTISEVSETEGDSPSGVEAASGVAAVAQKIRPSVVHVVVQSPDATSGGGSGSGFFISQDGLLITNHHVATAAGANALISIQTADGETYEANIVGTSPEYDLAVLRAKGIDKVRPVTLGNAKQVQVGEQVIAVGSPLGLQGTVTSGIVSALDRAVVTGGGTGESSYLSAIQTDAAINPGNSGGPLVSMRGDVIGVNTAIATVSGASQSGSIGLGFAVPMNIVKRVSKEIIETGSANTPVIGVEVDLQFTGEGARMQAVDSGGPAAEAGMRTGDVIFEVDGKPVADASMFIVAIRSLVPGDTARLSILRNGRAIVVPVRLGTLSAP